MEENSKPKFMDLGLNGMGFSNKPENKKFTPKRFVKKPPTHFSYIGWTIAAIIIGISTASFATESFFLVYSKFNPNDQYGKSSAETQLNVKSDSQKNALTVTLATSTATITKEYIIADKAPAPRGIGALTYIVADPDTGEVILSKDDKRTSPMASVTKLMTAVITEENMDLHKIAIVSRDTYHVYGAEGGLALGEKLSVGDLLYPLIMESSNDAAEVIAESYGRDEFMKLMNKKAKEIGMVNTYYDDPSGLSVQNVTTVTDLFKLAQYIKAKHLEILDIAKVKGYSIKGHNWLNRNKMFGIDSYVAGKNGYIDQSKQTTVTFFNPELVRGGKKEVVIAILQANSRESDAQILVNYLKKYVSFNASN